MNTIPEVPTPVNQVPAIPAWQERHSKIVPIALVEPDMPRPSRPFKVAAPVARKCDDRPLPEVRKALRQYVDDYMATADPKYMVLLKPPPGTGKTYAGLAAAFAAYRAGKRVAYVMPRHAFHKDLVKEAIKMGEDPSLLFEWMPRQQGNEDKGIVGTCRHAEPINKWQGAGYKSRDFCLRICGQEYMDNGCPYYKQVKQAGPIVCIQHQNMASGHLMAGTFDVIIGDELPLATFVKAWDIDESDILPNGLEFSNPLAPVLFALRMAVMRNGSKTVSGNKFYQEFSDALTAQRIDLAAAIEACAGFSVPLGAVVDVPKIHNADDANDVQPNYLWSFVPMLLRELQAYVAGEEFAPRITAHKGSLLFDVKLPVAEGWKAKHVVWFDGTGDPELYRGMFGRDVVTYDVPLPITGNIIQVYDRTNGISTLTQATSKEDSTKVANRSARTELRMIQHIIKERGYRNPVVITYQKLEPIFVAAGIPVAHFYGQRGTNNFVDCDAIFVVGTPMPPHDQLERQARWFYPDVQVFDNRWVLTDREFGYTAKDGNGVAVEVREYADPRTNTLLRSYREAEIVQAAHRVRPIFRDVDVWLMTGIPLPDLPPTQMISRKALLGTPDNMHTADWLDLKEAVEELDAKYEVVTATMLVEKMGIVRHTALKYMDILVDGGSWDWVSEPTIAQRGRPAKAIRKETSVA